MFKYGKIRGENMTEIIHMNCLGALCESIDTIPSKIKSKTTMRPYDVTCTKCIKILKERKILR